ncbi:MAG: hypothetical protein ACM3Q2_17270, partial [Syntrophothermus sp.]
MNAISALDMLSSSAPRKYAEPTTGHVSLGASLRFILFLIPSGLLALILFVFMRIDMPTAVVTQ